MPQDKLHGWKDFPKGLHVLVAIADGDDREEISGILQSCSYRVTAFTSEEDALAAIEKPKTPFHAAMVDATNRDIFDGFKVLEAAKELAVIMISSTEDIETMMRAISLGAADFLQKPFSEEKLKNIWQHVARKAMLSTNSEPASTVADHEVKPETLDDGDQIESQMQSFDDLGCIIGESFHECEKFPEVEEPAATETKEGFDVNAEGTCIKLEIDDTLDDLNLGDGIVLDGEGATEFELDPSLFVGFPDSDSDSALDINFEMLDSGDTHESEFDGEEAMMLAQVLKTEDEVVRNVSESSESMSSSTKEKGEEETKPERAAKSCKSAPGRKKMKVDWTPELHQKFVQAVEQLGVDKAIPSRILEHMGVKCLTRHNIASHLQKYRSHRKHLLQREAEAAVNWSHRRHSDTWSKNRAPTQSRQTPILPAPPPGGVPLLVWGHPTIDHSSAHMWQQQQPPVTPPPWQAPDGTLWQHPAVCFPPWGHAPAPGTPVYPNCMRVPVAPVIAVPQPPAPPLPGETLSPPACHPPREVVDAVISEALTNPCTLPLGLKPPSMESVMSELVKQGITITPPTPS
ncbi:transcription activator GLK1 isoform X2 [Selaginella moellendorffii]|uniref:transcription activator GLK1 isoform X2 n=1 Tax=Selaginella moellendorffii TaxID=88036 RepID=UPI000D1C7948|nr:transcription activator GLK1 isoform X2 [Selaginella moellendorffii]|eukprot:XP_024519966.1 transcription activator GLK1 isoform X2 [Selaginella moellendorffii]